MIRLDRLRLAFHRFAPHTWLSAALLLASLPGSGQDRPQLASVHGTIRDSEGRPVEHATVTLEPNGSRDRSQSQTDPQGNYIIVNVPDGVYVLRATKDGYAGGLIPSVFLKPGESKAVDLTIGDQRAISSAPQFFDQPQFTVAGITDATGLGGHGTDTMARARDSLAKETISLGDTARSTSVDEAREKKLREAVTREPADFSVNHQLGQLLLAAGRAPEAIPFLQRAFATDPANFENAYDLALANTKSGNYTVAREQTTSLLASHDRADLHHLLGDVDEKLGDSLEAVRHYQRAAELEPTEPNLFDWGAELLLHHAPEPAIEVFTKGARLFPASLRMLIALGAANFAHGANEEAVRYICRASDSNPDDPVPYQFLGRIERIENTPSTEIIDKLQRFVTLKPRNPDANYYYALGLWKLRNARPENSTVTQVESLLKTALQIDSRYAAAALLLGILHSDQGAYADAIADYQRALAADPQMEEAHYRLAHMYRQRGESDKAKEELRVYEQLAKESAQKQEQERHEIKQFVYTLRDQSPPNAQ